MDVGPKIIRLVILNVNREKIYEHEHVYTSEQHPITDTDIEKYNGIFNTICTALFEGKPFVEIVI